MRRKTILGLVCLLVLPAWAAAGTKISGTVVCSKPDPTYSLPAADATKHNFVIGKNTCTWPKPMEIGGARTKEDAFTTFEEVHGETSRGLGFAVGTLTSGDQFHVRTQGKAILNTDGGVKTSEGTWTFEAGTGKIKGIEGGGTYKCAGKPEGLTCDVSGDYTVPK